MYNLPQEIEVWYIIPSIRRELAKLFVGKYKLTQGNAAAILGVSEAAISQYLSKKRAGKFRLPKSMKKELEKSGSVIIKNKNLAVKEILRLLNVIKQKGCSCDACRKYNKGVLSLCGMKPLITGEIMR